MSLRDAFKFSRKTFFNPVGWLDYENLKHFNLTIKSILRALFSTAKPLRDETFEQAMQRLQLTKEDVKEGAKTYRCYAVLFLLLAIAVFAYSIYLLFTHGTLTGLLIGIGTTGLFLSQAYKYDFWAFQMRRRKLGATYKEWKRSLFGGRGASS